MKIIPNLSQYIGTLAGWTRSTVRLNDDFDTYCDCDLDFIEILLVFENRFSLNLLESSAVREDFKKVHHFIMWVSAQPKASESYRPFEFHQPEIIPLGNWVEVEEEQVFH